MASSYYGHGFVCLMCGHVPVVSSRRTACSSVQSTRQVVCTSPVSCQRTPSSTIRRRLCLPRSVSSPDSRQPLCFARPPTTHSSSRPGDRRPASPSSHWSTGRCVPQAPINERKYKVVQKSNPVPKNSSKSS